MRKKACIREGSCINGPSFYLFETHLDPYLSEVANALSLRRIPRPLSQAMPDHELSVYWHANGG
jgi:hypothetical protein